MGIPFFLQQFIDPFFQNKNCKRFGNLVKGSPYSLWPDYLSKVSIIYSGGAGGDISFELDIVKKFDAKIFLFDPTPTGINTVNKTPNKKIFFFKLALSNYSGKIYLDNPLNLEEGSYRLNKSKKNSFPCVSLNNLMKKNGHEKIDLLKIDIEGSEYAVIEDILKNKLNVLQICVEFHHFFKGISILKTWKTMQKLKKAGYKLIFKDLDNFTFIKKDLFVG